MARPTKDPADALTYRLNVRMTDAEGQQLESDAAQAGLTLSDHATRKLEVRSKPRRMKATPERQALITGLGMLGHIRADINQLVKDRMAHKFVRPEDVEAALQAVSMLADLIQSELAANGD